MPDKIKCTDCDKEATWEYGPASSDIARWWCDDCVARGCTCNYIPGCDPPEVTREGDLFILNIDSDLQEKDQQGRMFPCVEYTESIHGYFVDGDYRYPCDNCGGQQALEKCIDHDPPQLSCMECKLICPKCPEEKETEERV